MGVAAIYEAATGELHTFEVYGQAGPKVREDLFSSEILLAENSKPYVKGFLNEIGYASILVPGTIAGLEALHERGGRLPWKELAARAIRLLEEGFPFYDHIRYHHRYPFPPQSPSVEKRLSATKEMARFFLPGGTLPKLEDPYRNGDYLESLRILVKEGPRSFYQGRLAQAMVEDWEAQGAFITGEDPAYQVSWVKPLKVNWGPSELCSNPSPGGGPTLFLILKLLQTVDVSSLPLASLPYYKVLLQSFQVAFSHRKETLGDGIIVDGEKFYREENLKALCERRFSPIQEESSPGTTHLTVADGEGNVVALTRTLGSCSVVITPDWAFPTTTGCHA